MTNADAFCCFLGLELGPIVILHYHHLSIFQLLHCLSLDVLQLLLQTDFEISDLHACLMGVKLYTTTPGFKLVFT